MNKLIETDQRWRKWRRSGAIGTMETAIIRTALPYGSKYRVISLAERYLETTYGHKDKVFCPVGNGECPPNCSIYDSAKELSKIREYRQMTPLQRRMQIVFGDTYHKDVNVADVANALANCENETYL